MIMSLLLLLTNTTLSLNNYDFKNESEHVCFNKYYAGRFCLDELQSVCESSDVYISNTIVNQTLAEERIMPT